VKGARFRESRAYALRFKPPLDGDAEILGITDADVRCGIIGIGNDNAGIRCDNTGIHRENTGIGNDNAGIRFDNAAVSHDRESMVFSIRIKMPCEIEVAFGGSAGGTDWSSLDPERVYPTYLP
jgi:hypothetical protein